MSNTGTPYSKQLLFQHQAGSFTRQDFIETLPSRKPSSASPTRKLVGKDSDGKERTLEILDAEVLKDDGPIYKFSGRLINGKKYEDVVGIIEFKNDVVFETKIYKKMT